MYCFLCTLPFYQHPLGRSWNSHKVRESRPNNNISNRVLIGKHCFLSLSQAIHRASPLPICPQLRPWHSCLPLGRGATLARTRNKVDWTHLSTRTGISRHINPCLTDLLTCSTELSYSCFYLPAMVSPPSILCSLPANILSLSLSDLPSFVTMEFAILLLGISYFMLSNWRKVK